MGTPHVAGAAVVLKALYPEMTATQLKAALMESGASVLPGLRFMSEAEGIHRLHVHCARWRAATDVVCSASPGPVSQRCQRLSCRVTVEHHQSGAGLQVPPWQIHWIVMLCKTQFGGEIRSRGTVGTFHDVRAKPPMLHTGGGVVRDFPRHRLRELHLDAGPIS